MKKIIAGVMICCSLGGTGAKTYRITAYSPGERCCGRFSDGITATGRKAMAKNRIVAVDPRNIPLHSIVVIEGMGMFYAEDVGGAIKGNRIDVLFDTYEEAKIFGVKYLKVRVIGKKEMK